ncbi:nucleolar complex protein 14 [Blastocladiella emersonii ATCC 22665]|nr:nucleolar complex protein 14 [Blastocladiella emersonii ATCC 22665]
MKPGTNRPGASGGSTLKRLKANLKSAGLIGAKAGKSKAAAKTAQPRQSALAQRADAVLRSIRSNNPFEAKVTKTKHDVLGRKIKGAQGRPGLTRQRGLEIRKDAILGELAARNRAGGVVDRRIGEHDKNMSEEEKMMLRWTREKQRASARSSKSGASAFNLGDAEDANDLGGLTHLGRSIDEIDSFDDVHGSDDEDNGNLSRNYAEAMFGGGSNHAGGDKHKSKADVMKEVMAKSKQHKAERQREREENEDMRIELDDEFDAIRALLVDKKAVPAAATAAAPAPAARAEADDFDSMVRELRFDKRAKPTDRTKTEEELAAEEKERLERLERDRMRRMNGIASDDEDEAAAGPKAGGYRAKRERRRREMEAAEGAEPEFGSDDELNGNVAVDRFGNATAGEPQALTYGTDGSLVNGASIFVKKRKASEMSDSDEEDSDEDGSQLEADSDEVDDSDDEDEDDDGSDIWSDDELNGNVAVDRFGNATAGEPQALTYGTDGSLVNGASIFVKKRKASEMSDSDEEETDDDEEEDSDEDGSQLEADSDEVDDSDDEDEDDDGSDIWSDDEGAGARRRRSAGKLGDGKFEMSEEERTAMMLKAKEELPYTFAAPERQDDFDHLMAGRSVDQVAELMTRFRKLYHPSLAVGNKERQGKALGFLLNYMWNLEASTTHEVRAAFDTLYPVVTDMAKAFPQAMAQWASDMLASLLGSEQAAPTDFSVANLLCFKVLGNVFSVSDFYHAVITPLLVVVASYLVRPPRTLGDAATGLFLTGFCIETQVHSKRWMPEVFNYLVRLVSAYSSSTAGHFPTTDLLAPGPLTAAPGKLPLGTTSKAAGGAAVHSSILMATLRQLNELDALYGATLESVPELYAPVVTLLKGLPGPTPVGEAEAEAEGKKKGKRSKASKSSSSAAAPAEAAPATMHVLLHEAREQLADVLGDNVARGIQRRRALQLQKHRAVGIAMAEPAFEEHYSLDRKYGEDSKVAADLETEKLKAQVKQERRGVLRELRRDAEFLASVRVQEQRRKDAEYAAKMRRIEGRLGDEIGELKKLKRESKRRKL